MSEDYPANLTGFRAGSVLAGYRLETQVGAGGMAAHYRARDERLNRPVALKILAPGLASDSEFRRRFIFESRAAAAVDDPHIIPVYEAGESDGVLFIAMRFVQGGDLRMVLDREGTLAPARAAGFISPVASALDAAHAAGLIHRDVKPGNILVDARAGRPDHVYLSDFGVSKGAIPTGTLTGTGIFIGTPDYSAPEQIQGLAVDGRSDQYALACVAYHLLTGGVPFDRPSAMAVMMAHVTAPRPSLVSRRPDLPEGADEVLAKAMAKLPEDRYDTCGEFGDALRESFGLTPYDVRGAAAALLYPTVPPSRPPVSNPPVESVPPPVESVPLPVESVPPPVESVPPPAKSVPPPAKSIPPPAAAAGPATMDMPGSPIPDSPAEPDVGRTVTIVAVPGSRSDSRPGAPAEAVVTSPEVDHGADSDSDDGADSAALPEAAEPAEDVAEAPGTRVDLAGTRVDTPSVAAELPQTMVDAPAAPAAPLGSADTQDMTPAELDQLLAPAPEPPAPAPAPKPPAPAAPSKRRPRNPLSDLPTAPAEIFPLAAAAGTVAAPSQPSAEPVPAVEPELSPVAESETAVAEPESAVAEPEAVVELEVAESEAAVAEPETAVEPESTPVAAPEAAVAEPETAVEPELSPVAEPEAAVELEPGPVTEPKLAAAEPEAAVLAPEPAVAEIADPVSGGGRAGVAESPVEAEAEVDVPDHAPPVAGEQIWALVPPAETVPGRGAGRDGVSPVTLPRESVGQRPGTKTALARHRRLSVLAVAGVIVGAAAVIPFVMMSSPNSSNTGKSGHPSSSPSQSGSLHPSSSPTFGSPVSIEVPAEYSGGSQGLISSLAFSPSGGTLAIADSGGICLLDVASRSCTSGFASAWSVAFSPDGILAGGNVNGSSAANQTIHLWNVTTRTQNLLTNPSSQGAYSVAFSHDGKTLAAGDANGSIYLWNAATRTQKSAPLTDPGSKGVNTVVFSLDDKTLAAGDGNGHVYVWDLITHKQIGSLSLAGGKGVTSIALSPDGKTLAAGDASGSIYLWDVPTKTESLPLHNPDSHGAYSVAFSHDSKTLAAGGGNGDTYVWNVTSRNQIATLPDRGSGGINSVVFSPDGKTLAIGDEHGVVTLWVEH